MNNNYENIICEAIETLVDKAVSQAEYDKTIQATIIEHTDATIGKYKVKYQDSTFYAYATDVSANYSKGSSVYILIHANNMEKDKTIIGAVEKLGTNYISIIDDEDTYNYIGKNLTTIKEEEGICSYKKFNTEYNDFKILFDKNNTNENKISLINIEEVNHYLNNSSILVIGGNFRTNLSEERKKDIAGEYGLIYILTFKDSEGKEYQKTFKIDNNSMQGTPYEYINGSEQKNFFEIEKESFISIDQIIFYCKDFKSENDDMPNDIFISDVFLQGAEKIPQDDLNGCYLTLNTPQGSILSDDINSITLTATLKVKGKPIQDTNNIKYYWFRENPRILRDSDYFHLTGGIGWECLNFIDTKENDEGNSEISFITLNNTFRIKKGDFLSKTIKYKCVAIYDNMSFSKEISVLNLAYRFNIYLETDSGDTVFSKYGEPIIKCVIKDNNNTEITDINNDNFKFSFSWASINLNNQFSSLANLENEENKIKINMSQIFSSITIKCAVYMTDKDKVDYFIGTAELFLRNRTREEMQKYSLVIENGNQVFKYNVSGVSPCVESLENPFIIPELTFSFYDPNERKIEVIDKNIWYFPVHNTMLELVYDNIDNIPLDETGEYYMITNPKDRKISYKIRNQYNPSYSNNSIKLTVFKDNVPYTAKTNFLFTKEGEVGTNGTDYVLRIIPNCSESSDNFPTYAELTKIQGKEEFYWNFDLKKEKIPLKLQIWQSGILVYEGSGWGNDVKIQAEEASSANILWRNLIHTYSDSSDTDSSNFILKDGSPEIVYNFNSNLEAPANLIQAQAKINNCYYYAVAPIITSEVSDSKYRIKLKENTGFFSVLYSSDGMYPQYDSQHPFEIEVDGVDSLENLSYTWSVRNQINGKNLDEDYLIKIPKENEKINTATFKPINRCKAEALNVSIRCDISENKTNIGYINIPIYFYLNRYGQAALNGWDGNSIDINKEGGYILSPQIGAGKKDEDNSFTGVFMGEIKEYNNSQEIWHNGILGYHKGKKSLFINAEDGSAIFGKYSTGGQIIVDPKTTNALLYSANFFNEYSSDGKPTNYGEGNKTGEGMLINLSLPEIRFGNGNFIVNSNGNLTAVNGYFKGELHSAKGDIGGWKIEKKSLYHDGYTVGMGAFNKVYSETEENLGDDANYGIQVAVQIANKDAENGYETKNKAAAFWAGGSISINEDNTNEDNINEDNTNEDNITILNNPAFFVSHDGYLKVTEASIGAGANPIFVGKSIDNGESAIYTFKKNSFSGASSQNGFYLGESGIAIGTYQVTDENSKPITSYNAFEVNKEGYLTARKGYIGDGANGWEIGAEALVHNKKTSMFMGKDEPFIKNPYLIKDGTYLGVDGFELGFSQLDLKYKVALPSEEDGEEPTVIIKQKQIYAPGFWVKRGAFSTTSNESGQVGINRGILAGTWDISEEGIVSTKYNKTNVNSYLGESSPNLSYSETIPMPSTDGYLTAEDGSQIKISTRTHMVKLLSFCLPNQIDRAIGLWGEDGSDDENFAYSYQRIVAGKPLAQPDSRLSAFGAKKWAWELMDDGSMYARRAVISTNFYKTFDLPEKGSNIPTDGVYIGPEGLCIGKKFAIDKEGNVLRGISNYHITQISYTGTNSVKFSFQSNVDTSKTYYQNFTISRDTEERIIALTANNSGNYLPPDYKFNTITVTYEGGIK